MSTEDQFFTTQIAQQAGKKQKQTQKQHDQQQQKQTKLQVLQQSQNSLKKLLSTFNKCDERERGVIKIQQATKIIQSYNFPTDQIHLYYKMSLPCYDEYVSFDEFLFIFSLAQAQLKTLDQQYQLARSVDPKLVQFLKLLNNYRKKVEKQLNYKEAKKSKSKVEEIRERELIRKKNHLNLLHEKEISQLQQSQKAKFVQFCNNWDQYMIQYENSAVELITKMKQKHDAELVQYIQKTKAQLAAKVHFSKHIIQLMTLEKNLVKAQQYEKADKVKQQIQDLKIQQLAKKQKQDLEILQMRCTKLRKQQQANMNSMLQKIQRDRNDQIKQRQQDSQKLIIRNKAQITQINHRHTDSIKRIYEALHNLSLDANYQTISTKN